MRRGVYCELDRSQYGFVKMARYVRDDTDRHYFGSTGVGCQYDQKREPEEPSP